MGSYKAYLEQGLDLCPKIYVQEEPEPPLQHADDPEPPDNVSQGKQFDYERTASSSNPTRGSQDTGIVRNYIASSSVPTRSSQDTRFALTTSSSNCTRASQEIQVTPGIVSASSSNPTARASQDSYPAGSTPPNNSIHANQNDFKAPPRNPTPSTPRSNPLPSHPTHLLETGNLQTQSLNSEDRNPSPPPAAPHQCDPYPPCAKRLWSKVLCSPPAPAEAKSPRSSGLWPKVLCSPATPPQERESPEPQAPRPHRLFTRRRRSSVPLLELSSAELQPKYIGKERRQSTPMLISARTETWPPKTRRQRSLDSLSPNRPDQRHQTPPPFPQRSTRSSRKDPVPIHAPPSSPNPYPTPYPLNPSHHHDLSSLLSLQHHLHYTFTTPSLLSQALTPPTPGNSGNARLSYLGRRVMDLVLWESCFTLRLSERAAREAAARALGMEALVRAGMRLGLRGFVGRGGGDLATEVRRGVLAVVGAVYWDGGVEGVRGVMGELGVGIEEG